MSVTVLSCGMRSGHRVQWDTLSPLHEIVELGKGALLRFRAEAGWRDEMWEDGTPRIRQIGEYIEVVRCENGILKFEVSSPVVRYVYRWRDQDGKEAWFGDNSVLELDEWRSGYFTSVAL